MLKKLSALLLAACFAASAQAIVTTQLTASGTLGIQDNPYFESLPADLFNPGLIDFTIILRKEAPNVLTLQDLWFSDTLDFASFTVFDKFGNSDTADTQNGRLITRVDSPPHLGTAFERYFNASQLFNRGSIIATSTDTFLTFDGDFLIMTPIIPFGEVRAVPESGTTAVAASLGLLSLIAASFRRRPQRAERA